MNSTDLYLASLCYASYWDVSKFDHVLTDGDVWVGIKGNNVCFRGSTTREDWERDLLSIQLTAVPGLGRVGSGFVQGMMLSCAAILTLIDQSQPINVTGHSLGAARAQIFCAWIKYKYPTAELTCVTFGTPRTGDLDFKKALSTVTARAYLNGSDVIENLPEVIPDHPFTQAVDRIALYCEPVAMDPWLFAKYHHFQLYMAAAGLAFVQAQA